MKKFIVIIALCVFIGQLYAQEINGILFESRYPVTIRLDGLRVNVPSQTTFIANLRPGVYNVQADINGRIIYTDQIRYSGRGTLMVGLDKGGNRPSCPGQGYPSDYVEPMNSRQFDTLLKSVSAEAFDDKKIPVMKMAAIRGYFTSSQIASLIRTLSFSKSQIDMAKFLFKNCTDPENYYTTVGNSFTFSTDKWELEKYLESVMREMGIK